LAKQEGISLQKFNQKSAPGRFNNIEGKLVGFTNHMYPVQNELLREKAVVKDKQKTISRRG